MWGGNNVSLKASLEHGAPMQVGWMRFVLGGIVTLAYLAVRRESLAIARHEVKPLLVLGALFSVQLIIMNVGRKTSLPQDTVSLLTPHCPSGLRLWRDSSYLPTD